MAVSQVKVSLYVLLLCLIGLALAQSTKVKTLVDQLPSCASHGCFLKNIYLHDCYDGTECPCSGGRYWGSTTQTCVPSRCNSNKKFQDARDLSEQICALILAASGGSASDPPHAAALPSTPGNDTSENSSNSNGLSTAAEAGIGVGVALGVLAAVAITMVLMIIRRKRRQREPTAGTNTPQGPDTFIREAQSNQIYEIPTDPTQLATKGNAHELDAATAPQELSAPFKFDHASAPPEGRIEPWKVS